MHLLHYHCPIEQLGKRYTLIRLLGSGGMGDVYLAWNEHDHHEVAIKVIRPDMLNSRMLQRFFREGKVAASLDHHHIIHIDRNGVQEETFTDSDTTSSNECKVPYIVMEYAKGGDLKKWLKSEQALPLDEIVHIFEQLCAAVQYIHDRGMIHRDIKPGNILFRESLRHGGEIEVILSDFDMAVGNYDTLSHPKAGTLAYMAPEQLRGDPQQASDIFALGVVLYQLCTGCLPSSLELPTKPTLLNSRLPHALDEVILRALSKEPAQRFISADLFWQAIQSAVRETPLQPQTSRVDNRLPSRVLPVTPSPQNAEEQDSAPFKTIAGRTSTNSPGTSSAHISSSPIESPISQDTSKASENLPSSAIASIEGMATTLLKSSASTSSRSNGKVEVAETAGDVASVKAAGETHPPTRNLSPIRPTGTGIDGPGNSGRTPPAKYNRRILIIIALVIVALLFLLAGGWAITTTHSPIANLINPNVLPSATITVTPANKTVQDTFNLDNRQITVRQLNSTKTATETVNATGHAQIPAVAATGTITFFNNSPIPVKVPAGTTFQVGNVQIAIDEDVIVPPVPLPPLPVPLGGEESQPVPAHALQGGAAGNIAAFAINQHCCGPANITAQNQNAFTSGKDAADYTFLQQSDVDGVSNTDKKTQTQITQNDIKDHMQSVEQLLGDINCNDAKVTADVPPGDQGAAKAITLAHVTISVTCSAEVFDANAVQAIAQNALKQKASKDPGVGYVLTGHIVIQAQQLQTQRDGSIIFSVTAKGVWYYPWTDTMKQDLLNKIRGKSITQAQAILNNYPGVSNVKINSSNGGTTLPSDVKQIMLDVKTVNGL